MDREKLKILICNYIDNISENDFGTLIEEAEIYNNNNNEYKIGNKFITLKLKFKNTIVPTGFKFNKCINNKIILGR